MHTRWHRAPRAQSASSACSVSVEKEAVLLAGVRAVAERRRHRAAPRTTFTLHPHLLERDGTPGNGPPMPLCQPVSAEASDADTAQNRYRDRLSQRAVSAVSAL